MTAKETVFVTGASGFIAKHIVVKLLNAGYDVVGSVRALSRAAEVRDAVAPHLDDPAGIEERLRFAALDLGSDDGWAEALQGSDILMHTASPFPLEQPDDEDEVIRPAVDGALRALKAAQAAGIGRVVLTSSSVAVMNADLSPGKAAYDEDDWTDIAHPAATAYVKSKTLAEKAAWDFVEREASEIALTVINPVFVLGAPLDGNYGTSIKVIERLLRAKDPMLPKVGFPSVDVGDVAEMHLRALTNPDTVGRRFIAADRFLWFQEMAEILKAAHPDRKIVTRTAPNAVVRILALFDRSIRTILPVLGERDDISNGRARAVMGMDFTDVADSVRAAGAYLVDNDIV
ncbi:MAG: aldehyde reductase [Rhodobacter sp.]|nr:aldehyde reductase [Rhodobacter sp.]